MPKQSKTPKTPQIVRMVVILCVRALALAAALDEFSMFVDVVWFDLLWKFWFFVEVVCWVRCLREMYRVSFWLHFKYAFILFCSKQNNFLLQSRSSKRTL